MSYYCYDDWKQAELIDYEIEEPVIKCELCLEECTDTFVTKAGAILCPECAKQSIKTIKYYTSCKSTKS